MSLCLASQTPSESDFFVPAGTDLGVELLRLPSKSILAEYRLRSFSPWLASISLDVAVGGDVVQDPAQVFFIISKIPYSTKIRLD